MANKDNVKIALDLNLSLTFTMGINEKVRRKYYDLQSILWRRHFPSGYG